MSRVGGLTENESATGKRTPMRVHTVVTEESAALPARPLNVCMIGYTLYNSDGRVMRYAETLAKRGDRVDFIALSKEAAAPRRR